MMRAAQRELAKTDVFAFGEYVFGYEPAPHHRQMVQFILDQLEQRKHAVVLAPRGAAKSTWGNTILASWLVATRPDIRIGLFSQKDSKAWSMSAAVRYTVSESERFREIFGNLKNPAKWSDAEWLRKDSKWTQSKDRTMVAAGANSSSAVSKRFDLLLLDDVLDEDNTYTIDRRDKTETWFWKTLIPTLVPNGSVVCLGTRWAEGDLYEKLIETNKWPSLVISAITTEPNGAQKSYWPSVYPLEKLYEIRNDVGADNFACSFLNDVSGIREGLIFHRDWYTYFSELPTDRRYIFTMGVDLATSTKQRADFTALAIVAEDDKGHHWVLHTDRTKIESGHKAFVESGLQWALTNGYQISKIIIESNQAQAALVEDMAATTKWPIVGQKTDVDKITRARWVAARYEAGRVHHHLSLKGEALETEETSLRPNGGGHDDLIDALGLALDLRGSTGDIAIVEAAPRPVAKGELPTGRELVFRSGRRLVPDHVAAMLTGVETAAYDYDEAIALANQRMEQQAITRLVGGLFRR